ncbi:ATP-dependent zinc metalloprotease FtsH [Coprobacillus cateniformis]|nr:ATP-dependent zinc metalloprotease FtsH [Coprobacillus cateniformis]
MKKKTESMKKNSIIPFLYGLVFIAIYIYLRYTAVTDGVLIAFLLVGLISLAIITYNQLRTNEMAHRNEILTNEAVQLTQTTMHSHPSNRHASMKSDTENSTPTLFKVYSPDNMKTRMSDVAGCSEVKEDLMEVIDFLKNPQKYNEMGAHIPHGILFMGPPGTGKTMLARAVAGEANVKYIYCSGSEFVEKFSGVGAARVRELFEEAKKAQGPCIIFIDEIDAIGGARNLSGNDAEKDKTLNQLLVEMDGFEKSNDIIVIAATNRKDMLDEALLRPGRFDRQILVGLPTKEERLEILKVHSKNKKVSLDLDLESISRKTPGFSGAQLAAVLNESALFAVRENKPFITNDFVDEAIDRVLMGPSKKNRKYIDIERNIVAYHEAGHAVVGLTLENAMQVEKITIIPRGDAGGYNLFSEKEERFLNTKNSILAEITGLLAGRAAEDLMFNDITNGATSDLKQATNLARRYICQYGMSQLGLVQMDDVRNLSPRTSEKVDIEIKSILDECYLKSKDLLTMHKNLLDAIALELLDKETIDSTQIQKLACQYC